MIIDTLLLDLPTGQKLKFSLRERFYDGERYYIVNLIDTELNCYKVLNAFDKQFMLGIEIFKEKAKPYKNLNHRVLLSEIVEIYSSNLCE